MPWELAYCLPQSEHATLQPQTQVEVCLVHISLLPNTLTHLSHGYFSPRCTPMCTVVCLKDCWHTRQSLVSLGTAGTWNGTSATSLAWAPSGRSSPQRRADTCCLTHFKDLFFTTPLSPAGWGSTRAAAGTSTSTAAGPTNPYLDTSHAAARPSTSSSLDNPTSVVLIIRRMIPLPGWNHQLQALQHQLEKILIGQDWNEKWDHTLDCKISGKVVTQPIHQLSRWITQPITQPDLKGKSETWPITWLLTCGIEVVHHIKS